MEYFLMAAFVIPILMYLLTLFQEHCELFPVTNDAFDQEWPPISDENFSSCVARKPIPRLPSKYEKSCHTSRALMKIKSTPTSAW